MKRTQRKAESRICSRVAAEIISEVESRRQDGQPIAAGQRMDYDVACAWADMRGHTGVKRRVGLKGKK